MEVYPIYSQGLRVLRSLYQTSWGIVVAIILCVSQGVPTCDGVSSQEFDNAAHFYRRAFEEVDRLSDVDVALPEPNEPLPTDSRSAQIVSRLESALKCMHEATKKRVCDWENDLDRNGAAASFPHLANSRELVKRAIFRARYYWQFGRREQAIADLQAVIVLARRVGDEGRTGLVGLTERYKIEETVVGLLRKWAIDAESAQLQDGLCRLALQPEENLPKIALLLEREILLPWARRLITASDLSKEDQQWRDQFFGQHLTQRGAPWILRKLDEAEVHYTEVGDLLDLPIDQFITQFHRYLRKLDGAGNPISQIAIVECPGIPGAYLQSRKLHAQWTILQAASRVLQYGPDAVKKTIDPYGTGPLTYRTSADGFTIRSALVIDGNPIELSFAGNTLTPVFSKIHTVSIHVKDVQTFNTVYDLLGNDLGLPKNWGQKWTPGTEEKRMYAAFWAGNMCIEPCGPYDTDDFESNAGAMFFAVTFLPFKSSMASAKELDVRGLGHDGKKVFLSATDPHLSSGNCGVCIMDMGSESREKDKARETQLQQQFLSANGGPLGLIRVEEILVHYTGDEGFQRWASLLKPAQPSAGNLWRLGNSPAIRLIKHENTGLAGLVFKVRSLSTAIRVLTDSDMLGEVHGHQVKIDEARACGLTILLRE